MPVLGVHRGPNRTHFAACQPEEGAYDASSDFRYSKTPLDAVIFREDPYPRIETSRVTVQKHAETLDLLPRIEANHHDEMIDGWHLKAARHCCPISGGWG
jgi:hypothetical protein